MYRGPSLRFGLMWASWRAVVFTQLCPPMQVARMTRSPPYLRDHYYISLIYSGCVWNERTVFSSLKTSQAGKHNPITFKPTGIRRHRPMHRTTISQKPQDQYAAVDQVNRKRWLYKRPGWQLFDVMLMSSCQIGHFIKPNQQVVS